MKWFKTKAPEINTCGQHQNGALMAMITETNKLLRCKTDTTPEERKFWRDSFMMAWKDEGDIFESLDEHFEFADSCLEAYRKRFGAKEC